MKTIHTIALAISMAAGASQSSAATNLVVNGGFEAQTVQSGDGFDTFNAGSQGLAGWTIGLLPTASVDLVSNSYWNAASGNNSLDLNGLRKANISQVLSTVVGQLYTLSFDLSGNFKEGDPVKGLSVNISTPGVYRFDTTGHSATNMGWAHYSILFVAEKAQTTLSFSSLVNGRAGPVLDNISVTAVPEPETYALMLAGLGLMATVARRRKQSKAA